MELSKVRTRKTEPAENSKLNVTKTVKTFDKRGPKSVTCYICGREFGSASFPIHEPKCFEVTLLIVFLYSTVYHFIRSFR